MDTGIARTLASVASAALLAVAFRANAAEVKREGPLAGLPSKPGPHVERINALGDGAARGRVRKKPKAFFNAAACGGDDTWLNLGCPAPDPTQGKEGVARGRAWGGRSMCSAPDLRGAFHTGEGVHAGRLTGTAEAPTRT